MGQRQAEFNELGGRIYGISADTPGQNSAVMAKLALTFPLFSDPDRDRAITPLGFADENDPRQISRPGVVIVDPAGEIVHRFVGRDYADRPDEDDLLEALGQLGLEAVTQDSVAPGPIEPGEKALTVAALRPYFRGARFATLALRQRHRELGEEFRADTKRYVAMVDRYTEALSGLDDTPR